LLTAVTARSGAIRQTISIHAKRSFARDDDFDTGHHIRLPDIDASSIIEL
jgi:hypothetical protein